MRDRGHAFATVATALLRSGMRSVVAMAYSLYVSGAQAFLPAFYRGLFNSRSIAEGVRAGRQQMLSKKKRTSAAGPYEFEDWLLPVLYQQAPVDFEFAEQPNIGKSETTTAAGGLRRNGRIRLHRSGWSHPRNGAGVASAIPLHPDSRAGRSGQDHSGARLSPLAGLNGRPRCRSLVRLPRYPQRRIRSEPNRRTDLRGRLRHRQG